MLVLTQLTEALPKTRAKVQQLIMNRLGGNADPERTEEIMLKWPISLTTAAVVLAASVSAHAFTLTNWDGRQHTFTIFVEDDEWIVTIQPKETLHHLCVSGCSIAIEYDEEQDFEGREAVMIVDGRLLVAE